MKRQKLTKEELKAQLDFWTGGRYTHTEEELKELKKDEKILYSDFTNIQQD